MNFLGTHVTPLKESDLKRMGRGSQLTEKVRCELGLRFTHAKRLPFNDRSAKRLILLRRHLLRLATPVVVDTRRSRTRAAGRLFTANPATPKCVASCTAEDFGKSPQGETIEANFRDGSCAALWT